jgi:putative efflux protein, MATE family
VDKTKALEEEKISSLLWKFSVPAVTGMIVSALYNVVDSIFVGRGVGTIALTAVTIAFPVMTILMAVGMLVGVGAATLVSLSLGEKNKDRAEQVLGNAFTLMVVLVLATSGVALVFLDFLLVECLGVTPEVLPYAHDFTEIILLGSLFMHVGFGINNVIRAQGDPKTALATQVIAAFINIVLNYVLIFVFDMGIKGAAIATIIAQAVAAIWVTAYFVRGSGLLKLHRRNLMLRPEIVRDIFKIGSAPFLMQIGASLVMVVLNLRILAFGGEVAVATFGIINRVLMLVMMPVVGISQGAQPIIGYNYGARQCRRVTETLNRALLSATVICVAGFVVTELFAEQVVRLFNDDPQLLEIGAVGLRIYLVMMPIIGFQIIGANYFQAIGKAYFSIVFNLLRQVIILIPLVFVLSGYFGLLGVWVAGPIADFASSLVTGACLAWDVRRYKALFPETSAG